VTDVIIIGHGNVAIDCARILAKTTNELAVTDITSESLSKLDKSGVKHITLLGRRGHVQSSFTIKEIREMTKLSQADLLISKQELELGSTEQSIDEIKLQRPKKRIVELLHNISKNIPVEDDNNILQPLLINPLKDSNRKQIDLRFLLSPTKFISDSNGRVRGIEVEKNQLIGDINQQKAKGTGEKVIIPCQLVLKAVGYQSVNVDNVPFDDKTYTIPNDKGRIEINDNRGLYTVGWLKRGPSGIIGTNITCARETVTSILEDIDNNKIVKQKEIPSLFSSLDTIITWENYKIIENEETKRGELSDPIRPREKITDINTLIKIGKNI
jgi:adrenodoxin-NADP+ reductase